jgi:hypothetical protein
VKIRCETQIDLQRSDAFDCQFTSTRNHNIWGSLRWKAERPSRRDRRNSRLIPSENQVLVTVAELTCMQVSVCCDEGGGCGGGGWGGDGAHSKYKYVGASGINFAFKICKRRTYHETVLSEQGRKRQTSILAMLDICHRVDRVRTPSLVFLPIGFEKLQQ